MEGEYLVTMEGASALSSSVAVFSAVLVGVASTVVVKAWSKTCANTAGDRTNATEGDIFGRSMVAVAGRR